jgi:hypothetical protein
LRDIISDWYRQLGEAYARKIDREIMEAAFMRDTPHPDFAEREASYHEIPDKPRPITGKELRLEEETAREVEALNGDGFVKPRAEVERLAREGTKEDHGDGVETEAPALVGQLFQTLDRAASRIAIRGTKEDHGDGVAYGRGPALDAVNSPIHYRHEGGIECVDAIRQALGREGFTAWCRGNAFKYLWRAGYKGNREQDMEKAAWFARMASGDDPREK